MQHIGLSLKCLAVNCRTPVCMLSSSRYACRWRRAVCHSWTHSTDPAGGGDAAILSQRKRDSGSLLVMLSWKAETHSAHSACPSRCSHDLEQGMADLGMPGSAAILQANSSS